MTFTGQKGEVKLITLDPGHFHAALVQKSMYEQIDPTVHVYGPPEDDIQDHMDRVNGFNSREYKPTQWESKVYSGTDYLEKMLAEKAGNVVVLAGNNRKKPDYIKTCVEQGLNVLSDKPMCIDKSGYDKLVSAFESANANGVMLYDIMTERFEITTMLQRELAAMPEVFGELEKGTVDKPAVVKESVHHFYKTCDGVTLKRPGWYFDTEQQGEGIIDVTTHLVDIAMWACFPDTIISLDDVSMKKALRWPTMISREQFEEVTRLADFTEGLNSQLDTNGTLPCYCNGEMVYTLKDVHVRIAVTWDYAPPAGGGDTHYSEMHGTKSRLIVRQGAEQGFQPELYVEAAEGMNFELLGNQLIKAVEGLKTKFPGLSVHPVGESWQIEIPEVYRNGHEAHFGQVTEHYLKYLVDGTLPEWEVPNMLAKYYTTTSAVELARQS